MAASESKMGRQLLLQAEKILLHPIHPHLISYCPTMDLIAVVTDEENLDVFRINGQRAFGLKRKSEDVTVDVIQWEFNGKSIAVSWSDGSTDLVNAETGKVSHKNLMLPSDSKDENSMVEDGPVPRVKCIGWALNFINVDTVKNRIVLERTKANGTKSVAKDGFGLSTTDDWDAFRDDTSLEDFLQRQPDFQTLDLAPDLPDQLAMMDNEQLFPKLPMIPLPPALPFMRVSAADSGAFGSQAEVDSLLHSLHLRDHNSVDMFIRCSDRGTVHPSIYDSLETVNINLPSAWNVISTPLLHTSHPYSCSHSLLTRVKGAQDARAKLALVPLTLNFIPSAGVYLHLIASKTSQLQNLLLYISQTLQRLRVFFKHGQDLPSKFMMNISETLEEKGQGDLMTNLFHIACTGNCPPLVREWLVDELTEQGHKRWDNTVTTSLTTLLALVHENLIPALDRCSIVISRLRGLAQFHDRDWIFSSPLSDFTGLLEILKNLRHLAHTVLLYATEEKRQFHAFSRWLRFCIDFEATEPESQSRGEMETRDPGVEISQVLEYIKHGLMKSDLTSFLRPAAQLGMKAGREAASYEDTKKAIELLKDGANFKEEALCLEHVFNHLNHGVTGLLRQVSGWQANNIEMNSGIVLEYSDDNEDDTAMDMRMIFEPTSPESDSITTYIALSQPSEPSTLHVHRLTHSPSMTSLPKDLRSYSISTLDFSPIDAHARILDAKFADDASLLLLLQYNPTPATGKAAAPSSKTTAKHTTNLLLSIPFTPSAQTAHAHPAQPSPTLPPSSHTTTLLPTGAPIPASQRHSIPLDRAAVRRYTRHVFEGRFTPLRLVVNGRKDRRVVVVLGSDRKHYRVLDLDFRRSRGRGESGGDRGDRKGGEKESGSETAEDDGDEDEDEEGEGEGEGDGDTQMSGV